MNDTWDVGGLRLGDCRPDRAPLSLSEFGKRLRREITAQFMAGFSPEKADNRKHLGVEDGVDPEDVAQAGWAAILPEGASADLLEALDPLFSLRKEEAGNRFRLFSGEAGYQRGESKSYFLARHGVGPGPAQPDKVPYYLLLIGSPTEIPFEFQFQLSMQYACGRLYFDHIDAYRAYAENIRENVLSGSRRRGLGFFSPVNGDDRLTRIAERDLVRPLANHCAQKLGREQLSILTDQDAKVAALHNWLRDPEGPSLIFSAGHSIIQEGSDPEQRPYQGALVCADFYPPEHTPLATAHLFNGLEPREPLSLTGLIYFQFSCFSSGTPDRTLFAPPTTETDSHTPFISKLCRNLCGRENGAAAVIGHVDQAWPQSFRHPVAGSQTTVFSNTLQKIYRGVPVGHALESFRQRFAELSVAFSEQIQAGLFGKAIDPKDLAKIYLSQQDARGYTLFGDPAAKLRGPV